MNIHQFHLNFPKRSLLPNVQKYIGSLQMGCCLENSNRVGSRVTNMARLFSKLRRPQQILPRASTINNRLFLRFDMLEPESAKGNQDNERDA